MRNLVFLLGLFSCFPLAMCLGGCSNSSEPAKRTPLVLLERSSPEKVLANFQIIYGEGDDMVQKSKDALSWVERYRALFHPDSSVFKFYFVPDDCLPCLPEGWWGVDDEVASFDSLLNAIVSGRVDRIELSWSATPSMPDNRTGPIPGELLHPNWRCIYVTSYFLRVVMGDTIYLVMGRADFYFGPDPTDPGLWVITEWFDKISSMVGHGSEMVPGVDVLQGLPAEHSRDFGSGLDANRGDGVVRGLDALRDCDVVPGIGVPLGGWGRIKIFFRYPSC